MGGQLLCTQPVPGPLPTPFVLACTDGAGASVGVTFGAFETGDSVVDLFFARAMRYRGQQTWVVVQADSIYRTTDAGATWSTVYGPDADLGSTVTKSGLHLVYPGGVATLMIVGYDGAGGYSVFSSTDGVTWSKGPKSTLTASTMAIQGNVFWQGGIFCSTGVGGGAFTMRADIGSKGIVEIAQPDVRAGTNDSCFAVFNDRLFGAWTRSTGDVGLYELVGLQWVQRIASLGTISTFAADRKLTLFVDQSWLYAIFLRDNPNFPVPDPIQWLWTAIQIDSALATTDVTAATLAVIHGGETNTSRVSSIADGPAGGSGTLPEIDLYFSSDGVSGTGVSTFRWNGALAAITGLAGGNSVQNSWPFGRQYAGNVFWTSTSRAIEFVSALPTTQGGSGVRWSFLLYSPNPSVDAVSVRGFQGTAQDEYACAALGSNPAPVLAAPSAGALLGNTITGLDAADNGATTFSVTWLAPTNGGFPFALGDYSKTVLEVF